ncbi:endoplasmic reticulum membrane sensor NFE2L1a isoform X2 [Mugil cephalus]|uniref:endoplasmic reticulum membrane sensor NFE2L1a isoform X2 n=1 Tax=Mugil cephalus TaxID=48193 RepID=UPI001FB5D86B|nr:endoplasmic reticulum membrane sensor NFE2L1a isoform X2 [Mugil cephalus]
MLYLKKYFTEGLIQMAILLSLCGVRVDVGLEPYLSSSLHEMILGPTSALTQTQFHNLRNRLDEGHSLHPKSVDLDEFFTARRLLGWVHSLDRLQVPHAELETWLVQQEPDPLPVGCPDQASLLNRASAGVERDQTPSPVEPRTGLHNLDDKEEEEEEEDTEGGTHDVPHRSSAHGNNEELTKQEEDQLSDGRSDDLESQSSGREPQLSPVISTDLELHWQDVLSIMEPESTDVDMRMQTLDLTPFGTFQGLRPESSQNNRDNAFTETGQEVPLMETPLQHGLLGHQSPSELEPGLLPLIPSAELDDHTSSQNTGDTLNNPIVDSLHSHPDHTDLLAEDPSEDFHMQLNAEDDPSTFNLNLLVMDRVEPENVPGFEVNFDSSDLTSLEQNRITQDLLVSPPSIFLEDEEDVEDEDGLPSTLSELLEDATILDEIRLLDMALEEGFSPEMAARLEEEGFLDPGKSQQETARDDSKMVMTEDQGQSGRHQQDGEDEADSDSGLSLDFSHSPASPSASEASSYSSSSSSSSTSSSNCAVDSPLTEEEGDDAEGSLVDMEVEVTIKQEDLDEEELGAVGGWYPGDANKIFSSHHGDHKLFHDFPWLEHIDHDHTYNQPSSSSPGKIPSHTKSTLRHDNAKPYHRSSSRHITESKMWGRDERRARVLKVPFSNEMIVNLPVEEFNELLTTYQLNEEQLNLIRDIRRRGKNKIAAQNCRKRKLDVLVGLEDDVSSLRRRRSRLLREKQEALRNLQEMKRRLGMLYQEVFSGLRDEEGRPLDPTEYLLQFGPNGSVSVASNQQGAGLPLTREKINKKQKDKKK